MSELEARFRVRLEGKEELSNFFKKSANDAKEYSKAVTGALKDSAKQIAGFAASTSKSLASLALGDIGIASQAKSVLAFRDSIAQLTVTAGKGADYMDGLREQIHGVSRASNQMQSDVAEALSAFVERTGDIETARKNLELYGKVATATGASIKDVAYVGVELSQKLGIKDPEQQRQALAILTAQGKMGAVEIRDLATKAPAMFSAAAGMFDVSGIEGLRGTGALAQVFARAFGGKATAGMTSTSVRQMFTDMTRRKEMIDFTLGKDTKGQDPYETVKQLIVATGGDAQALLKNHGEGIFTPTALAGVRVMAKAWRDKKKEMGKAFDPKTMGFEDFDRFKYASDDFGSVEKDFALRSSTGQSKLNASMIRVAESADKNLGESFDRLANHADKLAGAYDFATRHMALTAGAFGLAVIGKNVGSALLTRAIAGHGGALLSGAGGAAPAATAFATAAAPLFAALAGAAIGGIIGTAIDQYFGISDGISDRLVKNKNRQIEAEADARLDVRARGVRHFEKQGQTHGQAIKSQFDVEGLEKIFERLNKQVNQISVTIVNDRIAKIDSGGTRSEVSLALRGMDGIDRARP